MLVNSVPLSETHVAGRAALGDDGIELASDPQARQRGVGDQRQAFAGEVVDDRQDAKPPAVAQLIVQEIERPALVGALRQRHRRPGAERPLAAAATAHLKPFLGIEPAQLLVVHRHALALQQDMQPAVAEPPAHSSQLAQPDPDQRRHPAGGCGSGPSCDPRRCA